MPDLSKLYATSSDVLPNLPICELTEVSGNGMEVRTEITVVSGTGMKLCTGTGGTGMKLCTVPVVPVSISYQTYRSVRYRYWYRTVFTEVSGTGDTGDMPRYRPYRIHYSFYVVQKVPYSCLLYTSDAADE